MTFFLTWLSFEDLEFGHDSELLLLRPNLGTLQVEFRRLKVTPAIEIRFSGGKRCSSRVVFAACFNMFLKIVESGVIYEFTKLPSLVVGTPINHGSLRNIPETNTLSK